MPCSSQSETHHNPSSASAVPSSATDHPTGWSEANGPVSQPCGLLYPGKTLCPWLLVVQAWAEDCGGDEARYMSGGEPELRASCKDHLLLWRLCTSSVSTMGVVLESLHAIVMSHAFPYDLLLEALPQTGVRGGYVSNESKGPEGYSSLSG